MADDIGKKAQSDVAKHGSDASRSCNEAGEESPGRIQLRC
jgi:hypothetical protein